MLINFKKVLSFSIIGLLSNAILMVSTFIFINSSTSKITGDYFYFVTIFGLIANISLFGNSTYYNKVMVDKSESLGNIIYFIITSTFIFIVFIVRDKSDLFVVLLVYIDICLLKVIRERLYVSYIRVYKGEKDYILTQGLYALLKLFFTVLYYYTLINFHELVLLYALVSILSCLNMKVFIVEIFKGSRSGFKVYVKNGLPFYLATLFTMGYDYAPVLTLKFNSNINEVAFFTSAYKVISIFTIGLGIISQSLLPYFRNNYKNRGKLITIKISILILIALYILYIPFLIIIYKNSESIINLFYNKNYFEAHKALLIQSFGILGAIGNFVLFSLLQALDCQKFIVKVIAPCAMINVLMCVFLSNYGASGVSLALSISLILCALITSVRVVKEYYE